jgi:hypothetical protein
MLISAAKKPATGSRNNEPTRHHRYGNLSFYRRFFIPRLLYQVGPGRWGEEVTPDKTAASIAKEMLDAGIGGFDSLDAVMFEHQIADAIRDAIAEEREACAKVCLNLAELSVIHDPFDCAEAIRNRK